MSGVTILYSRFGVGWVGGSVILFTGVCCVCVLLIVTFKVRLGVVGVFVGYVVPWIDRAAGFG